MEAMTRRAYDSLDEADRSIVDMLILRLHGKRAEQPSDYMTVAQASEEYNVPQSTIRRAIRLHKLESSTPNEQTRPYYVTRQAFESWAFGR